MSGRALFSDVLLEDRLRAALLRVNRDPAGEAWLDDERLNQAIAALTRRSEPELVEANQVVTDLLLEGMTVAGVPGWDGGRDQQIHYVDWETWSNNEFLSVSQFRVDRPGGAGRLYVVCDVVLFVNGIPVAVVECKRRQEDAGIAQAIDQLRGYAGRLEGYASDGVPRLFQPVQLLVATQYDHARLGTITSDPEHFAEWKDIAPLPVGQALSELGRDGGELTSQEMLAAGVLRPERLLDLVRHFTIFMQAGERRVKVVARYQQYRAVKRLIARLRSGRVLAGDLDFDPRGGIVWHTQGSGKSLTMTFLVRAMRSDPTLRRFKVIVVTDRTDLQDQLQAVARLSGETVQVARTSAAVRSLIGEEGPGLVFAMIQKYRRDDQPPEPEGAEPSSEPGFADDQGFGEDFPVLNVSADILVLVDEAHRSHTSTLHARLLRAMPNAARVGFTGTPIVSRGKRPTTEIFGEYIDQYTLRDAEADGAVLPILYELREPQRGVGEREHLDARFEGLFEDETLEHRQAVQRRYAGPREVRESVELIATNARDLLEHYVATVLANGFKAQLTAISRRAAVRYRYALLAARDEMVAELEALDRSQVYRPLTEIPDERTRVLVQAWPFLGRLRRMDFVPVISEGGPRTDQRTGEQQTDPPEWGAWTDPRRQRDHIRRFKQAFPPVSADPWSLESGKHGDAGASEGGRAAGGGDPWSAPSSSPNRRSAVNEQVEGDVDNPIAFLIVQSMLLTGFDAPIEQVLYSDRPIRQEELLQAVARPNRPARNKEVGYFVDYAGVARDLEQALSAYDHVDVRDALTDLREEIPKLRDRHDQLMGFLAEHGVHALETDSEREACVQLLAGEQLRDRFDGMLRRFLRTLEVVLPRPEALEYGDAAKRLLLIQFLVRRRYRDQHDGEFDASLYGAKVRRLLDEHVHATGVTQRIPPIAITAEDFLARVESLPDPRARAAEMQHALRLHISQHLDEDPVRYRKLSERLDEVLAALADQPSQLVLELGDLIQAARSPRPDDGLGLDPGLERPLLDILAEARGEAGVDRAIPSTPASLAPLTRQLAREIASQAGMVGFAENFYAQDRLRRWLFNRLLDEDVCELDQGVGVADKLMQVVRARVRQYARWGWGLDDE
jgi:type I restriction enzyme R subunit